MALKLHRCSWLWLKVDGHPCWRVQKALDEQGIGYEIVKEPALRGRRTEVIAATGKKQVPAIEFEDGTWYREESKDMAARIRAGNLRPAAAATTEQPPQSTGSEMPTG